MLETYLARLQRLLGDQAVQRYNPYDLIAYINEARGIIAAEGECLRVLCPSTAGVASFAVTAGGSGYTSAPTVTVTSPSLGITATGIAFINPTTNQLAQINVQLTGSGYTGPPSVSLSGGGGSGATATAALSPFAATVAAQEEYPFSQFNPLILSTGTGVASILAIRSVAVSWGSMKPTLRFMAWGDFQAYLRAYNVGVQGYPRVWSQYGSGAGGKICLWPVPSQQAQMDLDCICLPTDLKTAADLEPIPYPWTNAVTWKAAWLAVVGEGNERQGVVFGQHYNSRMLQAAAWAAQSGMVPDYYSPASRL